MDVYGNFDKTSKKRGFSLTFVGEQPENGGNIYQLARWGLVIYKTSTVYYIHIQMWRRINRK